MKILLVGAAHQGKEQYARDICKRCESNIPVIPQLHREIQDFMQQGRDASTELLSRLEQTESWIVVCDEIGCGIVPVDAFLRRWREETGRLCCELAKRADIVERITCGIPQRLKG